MALGGIYICSIIFWVVLVVLYCLMIVSKSRVSVTYLNKILNLGTSDTSLPPGGTDDCEDHVIDILDDEDSDAFLLAYDASTLDILRVQENQNQTFLKLGCINDIQYLEYNKQFLAYQTRYYTYIINQGTNASLTFDKYKQFVRVFGARSYLVAEKLMDTCGLNIKTFVNNDEDLNAQILFCDSNTPFPSLPNHLDIQGTNCAFVINNTKIVSVDLLMPDLCFTYELKELNLAVHIKDIFFFQGSVFIIKHLSLDLFEYSWNNAELQQIFTLQLPFIPKLIRKCSESFAVCNSESVFVYRPDLKEFHCKFVANESEHIVDMILFPNSLFLSTSKRQLVRHFF